MARIHSKGSKKTTVVHKTPVKQKIDNSIKYVNLLVGSIILLKIFGII